MLSIAGQTAGPIVKKFEFILKIFFQIFFHGQRRALQLVFYITIEIFFWGPLGGPKKI